MKPEQDGIDFEALAKAVHATGVGKAKKIVRYAEWAYRLEVAHCPLEDVPLGGSRLGGTADVPGDFEWPHHDGKPLTFLAQLNLVDVRSPSFPSTGWLLVFIDESNLPFDPVPQSTGHFTILHFSAAPSDLRRIPHPVIDTGDLRPSGVNACRAVEVKRFASLPSIADSVLYRVFGSSGSDYEDNHEDEWRAYELARLELMGVALDKSEDDSPRDYNSLHHLLGHPILSQGDARSELISAALSLGRDADSRRGLRGWLGLGGSKGSDDWRLLLQLDSEPQQSLNSGDWCWVDMGKLFVWIRSSDLAAARFDRCWMTMQFS